MPKKKARPTKLEKLYNKYKDAGIFQTQSETETFKMLLTASLEYLHAEFEIAFAEFLPMFQHEGITYEAKFIDNLHQYKGSYIHFKRDDQHCKMDFKNRYLYRYDFHFFGEDVRCNLAQLDTRFLIQYLNDRLYKRKPF